MNRHERRAQASRAKRELAAKRKNEAKTLDKSLAAKRIAAPAGAFLACGNRTCQKPPTKLFRRYVVPAGKKKEEVNYIYSLLCAECAEAAAMEKPGPGDVPEGATVVDEIDDWSMSPVPSTPRSKPVGEPAELTLSKDAWQERKERFAAAELELRHES